VSPPAWFWKFPDCFDLVSDEWLPSVGIYSNPSKFDARVPYSTVWSMDVRYGRLFALPMTAPFSTQKLS
jgi:hypothetical protein